MAAGPGVAHLYASALAHVVRLYGCGDRGEDLYHEHGGTGSGIGAGRIWTLTEHHVDPNGSVIDKRVVFAVPLAETS